MISTKDIKSHYDECNGCPYYYEELDCCMHGEKEIPTNWGKKCDNDKNKEEQKNDFC